MNKSIIRPVLFYLYSLMINKYIYNSNNSNNLNKLKTCKKPIKTI